MKNLSKVHIDFTPIDYNSINICDVIKCRFIFIFQTIEERGNRSTHNMHSSMLELDRTKVALENATNQLMALQHKQFIENRVYDDDETLANVDSVPTANPNQIEQVNWYLE